MSSQRLRIVQLTDLHLTAGPRGRVFGSDVWANLDRVLGALPALGAIDRLVLTGDIANSGSAIVYTRLQEQLRSFADRLWLLPGNHDHRERLRQAFPSAWPAGSRLSFAADLGGCRWIGLDSVQPRRTLGRLGEDQLSWLRAQLPAAGPWVLMLHHPPVPVGCWWLDKDLLRDRSGLATVLASQPPAAIFTGHVHQEFLGTFAGAPVTTTPAVAYQYKPRSWLPLPVARTPAFRVIESANGTISSRVIRLS